jgi:tRNA-splicing ligase RtcB (3'-phosphate/5'-hydroxy nucleic acid ligase)
MKLKFWKDKMITGKDLMEWGLQPGPIFKTALKVLAVSSKYWGKPQVEVAFKAMLKDPELFIKHEFLAPVAQAMKAELDKKANAVSHPIKIINDSDIPVWGYPVDAGALEQIKMCAREAEAVALMADHHKGYSCPIGGVVAYDGKVSPSCVGYDIACGNKAVKIDAKAEDVLKDISKIMDEVWNKISFGIGRNSVKRIEHELFDDPAWSLKAVSPLKNLARNQLGTVGSGNHYVDIFSDESNHVWVGCHFGSRGLGHKIATWFLEAGGAKDGMDVEPLVLNVNSELGSQYLQCMELAGKFAYAGRDFVCNEVSRILGSKIIEEIHNHHNFSWLEEHGGRKLWVTRKGATPAFPGQKSFIGGSLGDISVIVEGMENDNGLKSLYSTVHGAGRVMGRMDAKGKYDKNGICLRPGKVTELMMAEWVKKTGVELRGAGVDESPHCYKRLPDVLKAHEGMIRVLHTLTPIGVAMAGKNEIDPYKD